MRGRTTKFFVFATALTLLAGCSSAVEKPEPTDPSGPVEKTTPEVQEPMEILVLDDGLIRPDEGGDPVQGGTFSWYAHGEPRTLDPAVAIAAATTGGVEMLNIFDSITRWNAEERTFEPRTAESVEANASFDEWTVKIREGIKFTSGEDYDAEAVKASQERYASMPAPEGALWNGSVESIEVIDPLTIVYHLNKSWRDFPSMLASGPGMIVAPGTGQGADFKPVGAGAFTFDNWNAGEELTLKANPEYWGGAPYLDGIRTVYLNDAQMGIDSLNGGTLDGSFALQSNFALQLVNEGYNGNASGVAASNVALINAQEGFPGNDPRVRKAIQLAIDSQTVIDRAYEGSIAGNPSLFPDNSRWATPTRGSASDAAEAKRLLDEAKADGYDGKLEYVDGADPTSRDRALTVQAQLEAVGFEVTIDYARTIVDRVQRIAVDRDYQMSGWSINFRDADPTPKLFSAMHSTGPQSYDTYTSAEMDSLIEQFQVAADEASQLEIIDKIQQQLNEDVPFVVWSPYVELLAWADNVHGITGSTSSMVFFDKAWKE